MKETEQNQADSLLTLKKLPHIPESGIIQPSNTFNGMAQIRLSRIPIKIEGRWTQENYYLEQLEDILRASFMAKIINEDNFTRILYYPQYPPERANKPRIPLATTLMIETKDKTTGRKKWETVGHVYGVKDSKLEELGFEIWKKDDYKVPEPKIEIPIYRKRPEPLNEWAERQGMEPSIRLKIPSRKKREGIRV